MSWICKYCNASNDDSNHICYFCKKPHSDASNHDTECYNDNCEIKGSPQNSSYSKLRISVICPSCNNQTKFILGEQFPSACANCGSNFKSHSKMLSQCRVICTHCDSVQSYRPGTNTLAVCPVCGNPYSPETTKVQLVNKSISYSTVQVMPNKSAYKDGSSKKKLISVSKSFLVCVAIFVLFLIIASFGKIGDNTATGASHSSVLSTPTPTFKAISFPGNGRVSYNSSKDALAPFYIDATECSDSDFYYIVLADPKTDKAIVRIYVHKQKTVEVDVPLGAYRCYIASGNIWYGTEEKFGDDGSYEFSEELFTFYATPKEYMGHKMTLYSVYNGNMESEDTDKEHFPN